MLLWVEGGGLPAGPEGQNPRWEPHPLTCEISLGTASVFCVSLDPKTNALAVTGGEDDKAFVWRLSDGELLFECAGEGAPLRSCPCGSLPGLACSSCASNSHLLTLKRNSIVCCGYRGGRH